MDVDLKPCPCCGGKVCLYNLGWGVRIKCVDCSVQTDAYPTLTAAARAWNSRMSPFTPDELDAIRRMFADRYPRPRSLSKIEQSIIDKCNHALARSEK